MSGTIGSSSISFSSIVTAYNNVRTTDLSTSTISMNDFRNKPFTDGTTVPGSGAISINSDFKGKTWQTDIAIAPTLSVDYVSSWSYTGSGTASSPYDGYSTNNNSNNSTATLRWVVNGNGKVYIYSWVASETNYDFAYVFVNGSVKWNRISGNNKTYNWTPHNVTNGQKIEFRYTKDYSVHRYTDKQRMQIYTTT
tara:strand:+ start:121 stop:705 length:585 start_codon:yes stop_codon:yes gene_type:complete